MFLTDWTERLFEFLGKLSKPHTWPSQLRKWFVLLAPLSIPFWLAVMALIALGNILLLCFFLCIFLPLPWLHDVWKGKS